MDNDEEATMNTQSLALVRTVCLSAIVVVLLMLLFVLNRHAVFSRLGFGVPALGCAMVVVTAAVISLTLSGRDLAADGPTGSATSAERGAKWHKHPAVRAVLRIKYPPRRYTA